MSGGLSTAALSNARRRIRALEAPCAIMNARMAEAVDRAGQLERLEMQRARPRRVTLLDADPANTSGIRPDAM